MPERRQHVQIWTSGIDETLQGIGGDAWDSSSAVGLRVPTLATVGDDAPDRYLMMLCGLYLPEGVVARIIGFRQLVTIGAIQTLGAGGVSTPIEVEVTSPTFRFPDANVSFGLTLVPPNTYDGTIADARTPANMQGIESLAFRYCESPALLAETVTLASPYYVNLTAYDAPNNGRPWGKPIDGFTQISDRRAPWSTNQGLHPLNFPVEGPGFLAAWASVAQTAGVSFPTPTDAGSLPPEWRFIAAYGTAVKYWRVAAALDIEVLGVNESGEP